MRPSDSFVGNPVRSLQTMLRVLSEDDRSLPPVVPDGIYGPATATAISAFQRREGLPATGIADQTTWEAIVSSYEPAIIEVGKAEPIQIVLDPGSVYRLGDHTPYIHLMQGMLTHLASEYATIESPTQTGTIDKETEASLKSFQQLANLPSTGELDKITWKYLVHHFSLSAVSKRHRFSDKAVF